MIILPSKIYAQDSLSTNLVDAIDNVTMQNSSAGEYKFKAKQLAIPVALIGIGVIGLESDWLKFQNREIRDELRENIDSKFSIDDFSQYFPMVSVYGLNALGIKGKHSFKERTLILGTAAALMAVSVNTIKSTSNVLRPDGSNSHSFPSGHTATAFMGAEFLRREYGDVSSWIGVAGYAVATGTGFFRMYNNKHWLTDVIAGAGIGILSTDIAYWLYPYTSKLFFPNKKNKQFSVVPFYSSENKGVTCCLFF